MDSTGTWLRVSTYPCTWHVSKRDQTNDIHLSGLSTWVVSTQGVLNKLTRTSCIPSVLWCCWLGGRKGIRPVENWVVGCWRGYLSGARCRLAYSPADATATHFSCFSKIQIGFTFRVPAHPGSPGKRAVKRVCVCVTRTSWQLSQVVRVTLHRAN